MTTLQANVPDSLARLASDAAAKEQTTADNIVSIAPAAHVGAWQMRDEPVELELMDRREPFDVIEVPEHVPNLLGQVLLEVLDFVVDAKGQKLIPNPAHGGEQMTEEYSAA